MSKLVSLEMHWEKTCKKYCWCIYFCCNGADMKFRFPCGYIIRGDRGWLNFQSIVHICVSVCLRVCSLLRYCLNVFLPLFKVCFQTFWIFGILGEKLWKEMVSDLKTFTNKGCYLSQKKVCFWVNFALLSSIFFGIGVFHFV